MSTRAASVTPRWYSATWRSGLLAGVIVLLGALLIGGLTSVAQQYLPDWIRSLSNSAGGWTMFSFLLVWSSRARPLLGGFLGIVAFQALNEGYGLVSLWRGYFYSDPFASNWTIIGLAAGPVLGVAAALTRHGNPLWRALGVTPLAAVLLGEGVYGLQFIANTTSPIYWTLEIVLATLFMGIAIGRTRLRSPSLILVVCVWLAGSLAFWFLFSYVLQ
ncbi:hypothetical protein E3O44_12160 [Cryobacterium algoricola]|uniref:Uncharacterized protein n=1 Tax=Cryobacterium algoricola TaxID=1259183 RepID=A0ABY2IB48_9MICO|nr:DUF6518 family protein [Cryobacterium algoricola]TFB86208.1 hypothetical protein E3O44_12160 [Cryobacterium algoricola]